MTPMIWRKRILLPALLLLIMLAVVVAAATGYASLSYDRLVPVLLGKGTFKETFILFSIRLPRIVITLLAGMALALSGAVLQAVARNPLADPGLIGINAGAGTAIACFFLFVPIDVRTFAYVLPLVAFAGAFATSVAIMLSATRRGVIEPIRLVLIGVGFSISLSGLMILLISIADDEQVGFIAKWLAGSVWGWDWPFVWSLLPWLVVFVPYILFKAMSLDLLSFSDGVPVGLGMGVARERTMLLLAAVALAAAAVAVTGGIAFVGLLAPHIARALAGARHRMFLPVAILLGGLLLLAADTVGRSLAEPEGIAAGIMVALIGTPYFIFLMYRKM